MNFSSRLDCGDVRMRMREQKNVKGENLQRYLYLGMDGYGNSNLGDGPRLSFIFFC